MSKTNVPNDQRQNSPCFLDATLVLEEPIEIEIDNQTIQAQKIGVEYGNYPTARMQAKLERGEYDVAFVYSNASHHQRYLKTIQVSRPIYFRSI